MDNPVQEWHENAFRQVAEMVPIAILIVDGSGRIEIANAKAEEIFCYTRAELLGQPIEMLLPERFRDEHHHHLANYFSTPHHRLLGLSKRFFGRRRDGSEIPIEIGLHPLFTSQGLKIVTSIVDNSEHVRYEEELYALSESRQAIVDSTNFSIISTDPNGVIQIFNKSAERMLGYSSKEMVGRQTPAIIHDWDEVVARAHELSGTLGTEIEPGFEALVANARMLRAPDEHEWTYIRKDGSRFPVLLSITALLDLRGDIIGYLGIAIDLSERKLQENRIRDSEELFRVLYESSADAHMLTVPEKEHISGNQAAVKLFGCRDMAEFVTLSPASTSPEFQADGRRSDEKAGEMTRLAIEKGSNSFEWLHQRMDGTVFPADVLLTRISISGKTMIQATVRDITTRKSVEEKIIQLAFFDALTGLPNRRMLMDRLASALSVSARSRCYGAVLFFDLDKFKTVNDVLGHEIGDLLLIEVAKRIRSCVREVDTVARLGGDEFVVLLIELDQQIEGASQKTAMIAEKIRATLNDPFEIKGHGLHSSTSIGISLYLGNQESAEILLRQADMAMYKAKDAGRNALRFFNPAMQSAVETKAALEADLRHAVFGKQLQLYYQIQVDSEHRPLGAEALVRWIHPQRGVVSPMQFIPIAEESSLILEIGGWVLNTACRQLAAWSRQEQTRRLTLAVNVSAQQFKQPDFVEVITKVLQLHDVEPSRLKLELTESVVLNDVEDVVAKMQALKALGVGLSMDDFGTGYSSLSYLKQLPLDQIKIDQSFVRDVITDSNDAVMVKTIIDLARNFHLQVIAEGVESESQLDFLKVHGCMAHQGFLFSKPVTIEEFEALLLPPK